MQGIREAILDAAGALLPMERVGKPVAIGNEGPGPDMRYTCRQRVDIAFGPVAIRQLTGEPVLGDTAFGRGEETKDPGHQGRMLGARDVAVVRNLTDFPQKLDRL